MDAAQLIEFRIRGPILVNQGLFVMQGKNTGYRLAILLSDPDLDLFTQAFKEVSKPTNGLRRHSMSLAHRNLQPVELCQQQIRTPFLFRHTVSLSTLNLSLNTALVKTAEQVIKVWVKIQSVKVERGGFAEVRLLREWITAPRANLHVSQPLALGFALQRRQQTAELFVVLHQGLTVIGEGQRHETFACQPTAYAAEDQAVRKFRAWWRGGEGNRFIPIAAVQRTQPRSCVEHRSPRVLLHESWPAGVSQRIDLIDIQNRTSETRSVVGESMVTVTVVAS